MDWIERAAIKSYPFSPVHLELFTRTEKLSVLKTNLHGFVLPRRFGQLVESGRHCVNEVPHALIRDRGDCVESFTVCLSPFLQRRKPFRLFECIYLGCDDD